MSDPEIKYIRKIICRGCDVCRRKTEYGFQFVPHILEQVDITQEIELMYEALSNAPRKDDLYAG